jgi:hypothetical protein
MKGVIYRLGTTIKDFGERRRWVLIIRLGLMLRRLV